MRTHAAIISAVSAAIGLVPYWASAGTVRTDVPDASYTALANQAIYNPVGTILSTVPEGLYGGGGELVANGWVLTAAHLTKVQITTGGPIENPSAIGFGLNGQSYSADEWITYPGFDDNNIAAGIDLALIHLGGDLSTLSGVTPVTRYTGTSEAGATGTIVGYGHTGTGLTGQDGSFFTKRTGQNVIDQVGTFNALTGVGNSNLSGVDFDPDPANTATNVMGSGTALPLEFLPVQGDSGGGLFINDGGVTKLAGVISFGVFGSNNQSGTQNLGKYGDSAYFVRVSQFNAWIDDQISALYWNNGAGGAFTTGTNWNGGSAPGAGNIAVFDMSGTYGVTLSSAISNKRIRLRAGNVSMNLGGNTYSLGSSTLENSLSVARDDTDNCSLTLSNGTMSAVDVGIAENSGTTGRLTIDIGGLLKASSGIYVGGTFSGGGGTGTLAINAGGAVQINGGMKFYSSGTMNNAGTVSWVGGAISMITGGVINNQAGGLFDSQANSTMSVTNGATSFNNAGLLRKSGGGGITTISIPFANTGTIQVTNGTLSLTGSGSSSGGTFLVSASTRLNIAGSSAFALTGQNIATGSGVVGLGSLVSNTGTFKVDSSAVVIASGTLNNSGTVDLNNRLILDYTGSSPLLNSNIQTQIKNGFAGGAWNGNGIASSSAAAVAANHNNFHKTAIGYGEASTLNLTSFGGQSVDSTSLLFRYTYFGDANLDGSVNIADFNLLAANFGKSSQFWTGGDFNYDGVVNSLDLNAIASNFGAVMIPAAPVDSPALGALVPEPITLAPFGMMMFLLSRRRRMDESRV